MPRPCIFPVGIPRLRYPKVSGGSLHRLPSSFCPSRSLPGASLLRLNGLLPRVPAACPEGLEGRCLCGYTGYRSSPPCERSRIVLFWEQGDNLNLFFFLPSPQNHWFTYNETMTVESVTQAVSNLALQFGEEDADPGAMVRSWGCSGEGPLAPR